jgi:hypothetical protein
LRASSCHRLTLPKPLCLQASHSAAHVDQLITNRVRGYHATLQQVSGFESNPLPFPIFRSAIDRDRRRSSGKEKLTRTRRVTRPLGTWTRFARKKKKGRVVGRGTWIPFHSVVSHMYVVGGYSSSSFPVRTSPSVFTSDKTFFWSSGRVLVHVCQNNRAAATYV